MNRNYWVALNSVLVALIGIILTDRYRNLAKHWAQTHFDTIVVAAILIIMITVTGIANYWIENKWKEDPPQEKKELLYPPRDAKWADDAKYYIPKHMR